MGMIKIGEIKSKKVKKINLEQTVITLEIEPVRIEKNDFGRYICFNNIIRPLRKRDMTNDEIKKEYAKKAEFFLESMYNAYPYRYIGVTPRITKKSDGEYVSGIARIIYLG